MNSTEIKSYLARRGVDVTEKRVIAARKSGELAASKSGRWIVSDEADVAEWAARGCPAGDYQSATSSPRSDAPRPLDTRLLLEISLAGLDREQVVELVHDARGEVLRLRDELEAVLRRACESDLAALRLEGELLEATARLDTVQARMSRLLHRRASVSEWAARTISEHRLSTLSICVYLEHCLELELSVAELCRRLQTDRSTVKRCERDLHVAGLIDIATLPSGNGRLVAVIERRS